MSETTSIEWTDSTWNTIGGCTRVDEGCRNCYAEIMAARFSGSGQWGEALAEIVTAGGKKDHRWTGQVRFNERALTAPLLWKRPRRIFVNSTADTFHESVPDECIDRIFAVMALCPQHQFQVLTKRPERARAYLTGKTRRDQIALAVGDVGDFSAESELAAQVRVSAMPLFNVWLGTSISDQASANLRIPHLRETPAAVHFISYEPALGSVNLTDIDVTDGHTASLNALTGCVTLEGDCGHSSKRFYGSRIDWVIVGGESGPGARPMHPAWARSLRDQCEAAGVAFFFKQWGEWGPFASADMPRGCEINMSMGSARLGKNAAGRLLDGREHNAMPGVE